MNKIVFIINSISQKSGSERVAIQLANQLAERGYDIVILNRDTELADAAFSVDTRVEVIPLKGNVLNFYFSLIKIIKTLNPRRIIVHNMGRLALISSMLPFDVYTLEHVSFSSRSKALKLLSKHLYKYIKRVIVLTQADAECFKKFNNDVLVIPNFTSYPIQSSHDINSRSIIAIGRYEKQKNFLSLLKAWKLIFKDIPEWNLNIYGSGTHKNLLQNYISYNKLENVNLIGPEDNIEQVYLSSCFFVMSSIYEGLPMVLIEAQTFGLPIISYDCPHGPRDVVTHRYDGVLVDNQNIDLLASSILNLVNSPDLIREYSKNALMSAQRYQPSQIIDRWINEVIHTE